MYDLAHSQNVALNTVKKVFQVKGIGKIVLCTVLGGLLVVSGLFVKNFSGELVKKTNVALPKIRQSPVEDSFATAVASANQLNMVKEHLKTIQHENKRVQSFGSRRDLWRFARDGLTSTDSAFVFEAYKASHACDWFQSLWSELATFAGGGKSTIFGPLTPERQIAIDSLQQRCSGFLSAGNVASKRLTKELATRQRAMGLDDLEKIAASNFDAEIALLYSGSPASIEIGLSNITNYWKEYSAPSTSGESRLSMDIAALLAACDLGTDCSQNGFSAQVRCALANICNKESFEGWQQGLNEQQQSEVTRYRDKLVDVINKRKVSTIF